MKDKTALSVFIIILLCLIASLCVCVIAAIFVGYPINRTVSPAPTASHPSSSLTPSPVAALPDLSITVSPSRLMEGVEAHIHIKMTNPGKLDLQDYTLDIWYSPENDLTGYVIQSLPLSSEVGEVFEQDLTWVVDYIPDNRNYTMRLVLLKHDTDILNETSVPIEFVVPTTVISISPDQLSQNSVATIHIQVNNPSGADMHDYKLLIGYAAKDDEDMISIRDIPLSLEAGEVFEQDIRWDERFVPPSGECELRMILLLPNGTVFTETKTSFTLTEE